MVRLRCTRRLLRDVARHHAVDTGAAPTTTRLGDWYAKRLNVGPQRWILATSEVSLLSVVVPAKDLGGLPDRISAAVDALLDRLGVDDAVRTREVAAMREVRVAPTDDASVRASMNWLAVHADTLLWDLPYRPGRTLADVNVALSAYPCGALGGGAPAAAALALLRDDVSPAAAAGRARRRR